MRLRVLVFPVEDTAAINQTVDRRRAANGANRSSPSPAGSVARRRPLTLFFAMCNDLKAPMVYEAIR